MCLTFNWKPIYPIPAQSIAAPQAPVGAGETVSSHGAAPAGAAPDQPATHPNNDAFFESAKLPYAHPAAQDGLVERLRDYGQYSGEYPTDYDPKMCNEAADTIAAQQAEIAALREEVTRLTHNQRIQDSTTAAVMEQRDALKADAERYRWLKTRLEVPGAMQSWLRFQGWSQDTKFEPSIDAAIDAARRGE
jgi:hypothetical protein